VYGVPKSGALSTTLELAESDADAVATATTTVEDVKIVFSGFAIRATIRCARSSASTGSPSGA
jgi:hypothetical protein